MRYAVALSRAAYPLGQPGYERVMLDSLPLDVALLAGLIAAFLVAGTWLFVRAERKRSASLWRGQLWLHSGTEPGLFNERCVAILSALQRHRAFSTQPVLRYLDLFHHSGLLNAEDSTRR